MDATKTQDVWVERATVPERGQLKAIRSLREVVNIEVVGEFLVVEVDVGRLIGKSADKHVDKTKKRIDAILAAPAPAPVRARDHAPSAPPEYINSHIRVPVRR